MTPLILEKIKVSNVDGRKGVSFFYLPERNQ